MIMRYSLPRRAVCIFCTPRHKANQGHGASGQASMQCISARFAHPARVVRTGVHPQFPQGYPQHSSPSAPQNRHNSHIVHNFHRLSTSILHSHSTCGKVVRPVRLCPFVACSCLVAPLQTVYSYILLNGVTSSHCPRRCEKRTDFASPAKNTMPFTPCTHDHHIPGLY